MSYFQTSVSQPLNAGHFQDGISHGTDNLAIEPPSSPWSSCTDMTSVSPPPLQSVHVVCNAPLVAPIPLPYHSPTFLQFELPDVDQDLSHPPYTQRIPKRKRILHEDMDDPIAPKRRSIRSSSRRPHSRINSHHKSITRSYQHTQDYIVILN